MLIIGGAGLAGHGATDHRVAAGAAGDDFFQDAGQAMDGDFVDHLFPFLRRAVVFQHIPISIDDFQDHHGFHQLAVVGKDAVGFGHVDHGNAIGEAADGGCQVVIGALAVFDEGGNTTSLCGVQDLAHAHLVGQINGGDIHGVHQGFFQGHLAAGCAAVVLWRPAAGVGLAFIADRVVGAEFIFKSSEVYEWLERRARLADHLGGAVEMVFPAAANHGFHVAGAHFESEEGALGLGEAIGIFISVRQIGRHDFLGFLLHIQVQGRVDLEAFFVNGIGVILVADGLDHVVDEIGCRAAGGLGCFGAGKSHIGGFRFSGLDFGDVAVLGHLVEHNGLAILRRLETSEWGIVIRAIRQARKHGALRERQILRIFAEVHMRRGLYAVATLAEINLVHVHFQDLFLGVLIFDFKSQHHFEELSLQSLLLGEEGVSRQLLSDGGAALAGGVAAHHIGEDGAEDPSGIDAVVFIETNVLGCHESILQILRHLVDGDGDAVLLGMHRGDEPPLLVVNARRRIGRNISCHVGQVAGDGHKESRRRAGTGDEKNDEEEKKYFLQRGPLLPRLLPLDV